MHVNFFLTPEEEQRFRYLQNKVREEEQLELQKYPLQGELRSTDPTKFWQAREQICNKYGKRRASIGQIREQLVISRVAANPEPFLMGCLYIVSSRGIYDWFGYPSVYVWEKDQDPTWVDFRDKSNTLESRRTLHLILTALLEIPPTWGRSAFLRFLRGTGKQAGAKYTGAGALGKNSGWTQKELDDVLFRLLDNYTFGKPLWSTGPVVDVYSGGLEYEKFWELMDQGTNAWAATKTTRNRPFIQDLIRRLEEMGI